ncbi:MAG: ankyrin repeat domain-containing protein [Acidiphilium sp.]|nr:ankyrin repeat domain-containing protein [Acidiphilium sp.]MDD4936350.1 ankyrin repeat domain-containing protein [Acidiphilium sp.]
MPSPRSIRIAGIVALIAGFAATPPAFAQMAGGGGMGSPMGIPGQMGAGQGLHAPEQTPDVAPPALPGATGVGNISAGPVTTANEDPTKLLFSAINHGDYTQARAAISRGANLDARNALDETPIELAVELNRNNIIFMLLSVRAEEGPSGQPAPGAAIVPVSQGVGRIHHPAVTLHTRQTAARPAPALPDEPGVPNPAAGFLGFGGHS